ncbi:hypothetical protein FGRMN_6417 [Fusarium graminum]|nr:hypothetical protein FGRMN_6417 [Fusarium graminum]
MSGAEAAIVGVGFLCNAMQIATFGRDILQVYSHLRDGRSPDPRLEAYLKSAKACFQAMNDPALVATQARPLYQDQQQVVEVGKALEDSVDKLQSKFAELHLDDSAKHGIHGKLKMGQKALASLWQGKELESLENSLKRYESLLHGIVLHRICKQSQAAEISSTQSFHQLETAIQQVIIQVANGCSQISDLSIACLQTRDWITQEHETTRKAMNDSFNTIEGTLSQFHGSVSQDFQDLNRQNQLRGFEEQHKQLLKSLRFPEMNNRKGQVSESYPGTFSWAFKSFSPCSRNQTPRCSCSDSDAEVEGETGSDDDEDMDDVEDTPHPALTQNTLELSEFPAWLESDSNLFWISGKPGSGKSSFMKFLATNPLTLQHLKAWPRNMPQANSDVHIITHFFWKPGKRLEQSIEGMMLSLLYQILCNDPGQAQKLLGEYPNIRDAKEIQERLSQMPTDLHHLLTDMWKRSGDDAELSSYKADASRYFSLTITAKKLEDNRFPIDVDDIDFPWVSSVRSLLVIATALEDKPLSSILEMGRSIRPEELQAMCAKVEDRLRLVCRGLLEVTTSGKTVPDDWVGNRSLFPYNLGRVDFIHRSAFDFITDTEIGRESLNYYQWSEMQQVYKLLGGHLVRSKFLCQKTTIYETRITGEKLYSRGTPVLNQLQIALDVTFNWSGGNNSFRKMDTQGIINLNIKVTLERRFSCYIPGSSDNVFFACSRIGKEIDARS